MKNISLPILIYLTIAALLSACGAASTASPTIRPEDVQNTAIVAAFTVIALTHEAQPTETSLPPTEVSTQTLVPTETPISSPTFKVDSTDLPASTNTPEPTFAATLAPTLTATTSSGDVCNNALNNVTDNRHIRLMLWNKTKFNVSFTIYLNKTAYGDCGYRAYSLSKGSQVLITDLPYGCYNASAYINDPKGTRSAFGSGCANNTDVWHFEVSDSGMVFGGP